MCKVARIDLPLYVHVLSLRLSHCYNSNHCAQCLSCSLQRLCIYTFGHALVLTHDSSCTCLCILSHLVHRYHCSCIPSNLLFTFHPPLTISSFTFFDPVNLPSSFLPLEICQQGNPLPGPSTRSDQQLENSTIVVHRQPLLPEQQGNNSCNC